MSFAIALRVNARRGWTCIAFGLLAGAVLSAPLLAQSQATISVGLLVKNRSATDPAAIAPVREALESMAQSKLTTLDGVDVVVIPSGDPEAGTASHAEKWVREHKLHFYVKVDLIQIVAGENGVTWWMADLRKASQLPHAKWPKKEGRRIRIGGTSRIEDMEVFGEHLQQMLQSHTTGAKTKKNVLISCFYLGAVESPRAEALSHIKLTLPQQLPVLLRQGWRELGYEGKGLDPTEVAHFCVEKGNLAVLQDRKLRADYVIEGVISMSAQEVRVDLSVTRDKSSLLIKPFYWDGHVTAVPAQMAKFIRDHWLEVVASE